MEKFVSLKNFRLKLTDYAKRIEKKGESFLVLKRSKAVFKVVPVEEENWETIIDFTQIDPKGVPFYEQRLKSPDKTQ
ncbi:MAG TPA: hypothetical protein VGA49_00870 [Patescibacteria group bacterium]